MLATPFTSKMAVFKNIISSRFLLKSNSFITKPCSSLVCQRTFSIAPCLRDLNPPHWTTHQENYEYEVSRDPNEWKYVENILRLRTIPEPKPRDEYPSGWRPVADKAYTHPYFVDRNACHLLSVNLKIYDRGQYKITEIKRIRGDIWLLHEELENYIKEMRGRKVPSYVNEGNAVIRFRGDYVYYVEQFLLEKGF